MRTSIIIYRFVLIMLFLLMCFSAVSAESDTETKQPSQYKAALDNLLKLEQKGIENADMYNQIGLSYYHLGYTGKAIVNFQRALRLNSNHVEAKNNLDFAVNRSMDKEMYSQPSFIASMFQKVFDFFNLNSLSVIVLILLLVVVLCLHWLMHLTDTQDKAVPVMWLIIFGFLLLITATMLGLKYAELHDDSKAVVVEAEVEGFSGPGSEYGKLFTIHDGIIIHINRTDKEWALVTLPNGGAGWVLTSTLERVKN